MFVYVELSCCFVIAIIIILCLALLLSLYDRGCPLTELGPESTIQARINLLWLAAAPEKMSVHEQHKNIVSFLSYQR